VRVQPKLTMWSVDQDFYLGIKPMRHKRSPIDVTFSVALTAAERSKLEQLQRFLAVDGSRYVSRSAVLRLLIGKAYESMPKDGPGKACTKCGDWKPLSQFSPSLRYASGVRTECKACMAKRSRENRRRKREKAACRTGSGSGNPSVGR